MKNPFAYQIENKTYTSAQIALQQALIALLLSKKLEQISVKALCERAAVARSTFYAYYENTSDLLNETENWFINELAKLDKNLTDQTHYQKPDDFAYFANLLDFVQANQQLLTALLIKNYDHRLVAQWKRAIKNNLFQRIKPAQLTVKDELLFEITASEVISAFIFYLNHLDEIDEQTVLPIIAEQLTILEKQF